jgi:hypothetical protein
MTAAVFLSSLIAEAWSAQPQGRAHDARLPDETAAEWTPRQY